MCSQIVQICAVVGGVGDWDYGVTATNNGCFISPQGEQNKLRSLSKLPKLSAAVSAQSGQHGFI
jgi:hypothetical protein